MKGASAFPEPAERTANDDRDDPCRDAVAHRRQPAPLVGRPALHDLIVILDDATSEIYYAQLVQEESTQTVMTALREVIEQQGLFCALYSDRGSHFWLTPKAARR